MDYEGGGCPSLLLEPSSTNLITQSEAFGNSYWTKSGASIEGDASTAGAEKLVNGDFATDSGWSKGTSWTISGFKANYDGVNNANGANGAYGVNAINAFNAFNGVNGVNGLAHLGFDTLSNILTISFKFSQSIELKAFKALEALVSLEV